MYKYFLCFTYVKLILIKFCLAVKCLIKVCKNVSRTQPNDLSQTADFEKQLPIPTKPMVNNTTFTSHNVKVSTYSFLYFARKDFL